MFELKSARRGAMGLLCGTAVFFWVSAPATAAPPQVLQDTYATAVIGDLPSMVNRVAELGNRINPGISGQALRGQIGMFLGDDGMKSIPAGSGLLLAVPTKGRPFALLETEKGKNGKIADVLQRRGRIAVKLSGDNLIIAAKDIATLNALDAAQTSAAAEMLKASDDPFISITLDTDRLAREKGPDFKRALKALAQKATKSGDPSSTGTAGFLNLFGNFALAVGERSDVATVKIDISGDGILFDRSVYPTNGVKLESPEGPTGEELRKGLVQPDNVVATFDYYLDTQSTLKALQPFFADVIRDSGLTEKDRAEWKAILDKAAAAYGDGFTGWASPGANGTSGAYVISVLNPDAVLAEIQTEVSSMSSGTLAKFYGNLGLETSATLRKNSGSIQGQPVHSFSVQMQPSGSKSAKLLSRIYDVKSGKFTFQENKMLLAMGSASLEDLAKGATSGAGNAEPVKARSKLDKGGFVYVDFYPGALAGSDSIAKMPAAKKMLDAIGDSAIYTSAYVDQERIRSTLLIPGDIIETVAKTAQLMKRGSADVSSSDKETTGTAE